MTLKGLNDCTNLKEKQKLMQSLIEAELYELTEKGYNRITQQYYSNDNEVSEFTPFIDALNYAYKRVKISHSSSLVLKSCLKYITQAAITQNYDTIAISQIKRRHIVLLFEQIEKIKGMPWTAHSFNSYRSYLGVLYKELVKLDIVPANLRHALEKHTVAEKIREILTPEQRALINEHLHKNYYTFWRFVQIFLHAGIRETEILNIRKEDVDLINQRFKVTVRKGKKGVRDEWRTIKTIALPLWQEVMNEAKQKQYLFAIGLRPDNKQIRTEQIKGGWNVL